MDGERGFFLARACEKLDRGEKDEMHENEDGLAGCMRSGNCKWEKNTMKSGRAKRWIGTTAALWLTLVAYAWGVELPWEWAGRMEFGRERTEWVVDLDGAPERVEVRLEGGGESFLVDEASWDGAWNGTPLGEFRDGTGGGWMATGLEPDVVTRHLLFLSEGGAWVLTGVRVGSPWKSCWPCASAGCL